MKKRFFIIAFALFTLVLLSLRIDPISAPLLSPYIAVVPSTSDPEMVGWEFTISISTDYNANPDVWGWNVRLTFDPTVLEAIQVVNGDLITAAEDPSATFVSYVNNTIGEVSAGAFFYYVVPPPYTTSGPGIMTSITFRSIGTGYSNITLEKETKLKGYDPWLPEEPKVYDIIDAGIQPDNIGDGTVMVTIPGDATYDRTVDVFDILKIKYHRSGPPPGPGGFDPYVDVNQDGSIDVFDILIAKAHLGESW